LVIQLRNQEFGIRNNKVSVGGGFSLAKLVSESVKNNLAGLEWAAGIPGTVGGAICNNAGAHGKSMEDVVEKVEIIEITPQPPLSGGTNLSPDKGRLGGIKSFTNQECNFSYRNSIFKLNKKYIIVQATLKLAKGDETESRKNIAEYLKLRKEKQPLEYPSAGSIFKNPKVEEKKLKQLIEKYSEFPIKEVQPPYIIPAGWFVEELDLKGKKIGGAMISEKHGNFIVNTGNAKAEDVIILISLIKQKVRDTFGIQLEEEIEYIGF